MFQSKVLQLKQTMSGRVGTMLIGGPVTGKSSVIRTLIEAHEILSQSDNYL